MLGTPLVSASLNKTNYFALQNPEFLLLSLKSAMLG